MARQRRQTRPLDAKVGRLETYEEQAPLLAEAEWRGRRWAFAQAASPRPLTDAVILDLHAHMFQPLLDWAGQPRTEALGPGGVEHVPAYRVREELRKLGDDFAAWVSTAGGDPSLEQIARIVANAHHRFQLIYPFRDTNGRTGRVLDHYILWVTFHLASQSLETSPVLVYFPDAAREDAYYNGLAAADNQRLEALTEFYLERLETALNPVFTVHWWDGYRTTTCVAIHDNVDSAVADARSRSTEDHSHLFRVLGAEGRIVARALGGQLVDDDGRPVEGPRDE